MKILMTTDTVGGVWTYSLELSQALAAQGVAVALATMGAPLRDDQRAQAEAVGVELHPSAYRLEWMDEPWDDVAEAGEWLLDLERTVAPDLVHLNGYAHGALPWSAPKLIVAHSCVCSWWQAVHGEQPPAEWDRYRDAVARGLAAADLVLAPTWAMLAGLECCHGPLPRIGVIPNGRRAEAFMPGEKEPMVFSAGRFWDQAKNLAALKAAAPRIAWPVYVAGETTHDDAQAQDVQALGRLGAEGIAHWLGRASVYALPARYEPFGLSALEAGLAGCALVLGDLPSLREVWGDAAMYVPPEEPDALAAAVNALAEDEARRTRLARAAHERAKTFTPQRMASAYQRAYRILLKRAAGPVVGHDHG